MSGFCDFFVVGKFFQGINSLSLLVESVHEMHGDGSEESTTLAY